MDKETLQKRISDLEQQQQQFQANFNIAVGAIQVYRLWLAELEKQSDANPS